MSQLTIRFHSGRVALRSASSSAVMIPPSGPSPGQRSSTISAPNAAYLPATPTIFTGLVTLCNSSIIPSSIGLPPISASALSRPNRVLPPPAKIPFAESMVLLLPPMLVRNRLAVHDFTGQVLRADLVPARKHHASLQGVL